MMRREPRVPPLPESDWSPETRELLERLRRDGRVYNIFATLARHPRLLERWLVFARHILSKSSLPPRQREIVILRTGFLCKAEYEWGHHVAIARDAGLAGDEIERIARGPNRLAGIISKPRYSNLSTSSMKTPRSVTKP